MTQVINMISNTKSIPAMLQLRSKFPVITAEKTVKAGDTVTIDYTGWYDGGVIFDTTKEAVARRAGIFNPETAYKPVSFVAGSDDLIRGFNDLIGMRIGESKSLTLTPDRAYGNYDPSLIKPVPIGMLEKAGIRPRVNDIVYCGVQPVRVDHIVFNGADLDKSVVYVDFNHPKAGKTLNFQVIIRDIRPAYGF
jgi:FKBP-type peptidyl-prolyl cis-trans isomerase 2